MSFAANLNTAAPPQFLVSPDKTYMPLGDDAEKRAIMHQAVLRQALLNNHFEREYLPDELRQVILDT